MNQARPSVEAPAAIDQMMAPRENTGSGMLPTGEECVRMRDVEIERPSLPQELPSDVGIEGPVIDFLVRTDTGRLAFITDVGADLAPVVIGQGRGTNTRSPEYPLATAFVPAKHFRETSGRTIERVVIHITDGQPDHNRTAAYFQDPDADGQTVYASAHYIVGRAGEVLQLVEHRHVAFHACSANSNSIGIEHCARSPREWGRSDPGMLPTPEQYLASARLVRFLCDQFGIPIDRQHILGHCEADPKTTHTDCPNGVWDWDGYMRLIEQAGDASLSPSQCAHGP